MPKFERGRLDGVWGMETFTAAELHAWADKFEAQINNPQNTDDPKWLQRRADKLRHLAVAKEKAFDGKSRTSKGKNRRDEGTNQASQSIGAGAPQTER